MKKYYSLAMILLLGAVALQLAGCRDYETYAEQKEKERKYIQSFLDDGGIDGREIKVISYADFCAQDSTTDASKNEYVLFEDKGVYMQIIRKGEGRAQKKGENRNYLCRYIEYSLADADTNSLSPAVGPPTGRARAYGGAFGSDRRFCAQTLCHA